MLDIGGEGRYSEAWNLNPRRQRTLSPGRGKDIPRRIAGRAEAIPLPDDSVDRIIVERTPLLKSALFEMARVIKPTGVIELRHAHMSGRHPHYWAWQILPGRCTTRQFWMGQVMVQESVFELA